jgi:hypothetical protein
MTNEQQMRAYLKKALEAEDRAVAMANPALKADWDFIAKEYYRLAEKLTKSPFHLTPLLGA